MKKEESSIKSDNEEYEGNDDNEAIEFEVLTYPATFSLFEISQKKQEEKIIIPNFQRNAVWTNKQKSRLIESFLMGLPIPSVFFYQSEEHSQQGIFQVIDGLQRVTAIHEFLQDKYPLSGVGKKYDKNKFSQLSEDTQNKLKSIMLNVTIIRQMSPNDHQSMYLIFERVNSGGTILNRMEIRRALSHGDLLKNIKDKLNTDSNWRKIFGNQEIHKRFLDVELILRIYMLFEDLESYNNGMAPSIDKYVKNNKNKNEKEMKILDGYFLNACKIIIEKLGEKPCHRPRLNVSMLDSLVVAMMKKIKNKDNNFENLQMNWENLKKNEEYENTILIGTSSKKIVNQRQELAMKYL